MKRSIGDKVLDKRALNKGRPKKISERDRRKIIRQVQVLRDQGQVNFTVKRVKMLAGLSTKVSDETVRLVMHSDSLGFRNAAKKGVLKKEYLEKRVEFARKVKSRFANCGQLLQRGNSQGEGGVFRLLFGNQQNQWYASLPNVNQTEGYEEMDASQEIAREK